MQGYGNFYGDLQCFTFQDALFGTPVPQNDRAACLITKGFPPKKVPNFERNFKAAFIR